LQQINITSTQRTQINNELEGKELTEGIFEDAVTEVLLHLEKTIPCQLTRFPLSTHSGAETLGGQQLQKVEFSVLPKATFISLLPPCRFKSSDLFAEFLALVDPYKQDLAHEARSSVNLLRQLSPESPR